MKPTAEKAREPYKKRIKYKLTEWGSTVGGPCNGLAIAAKSQNEKAMAEA